MVTVKAILERKMNDCYFEMTVLVAQRNQDESFKGPTLCKIHLTSVF